MNRYTITPKQQIENVVNSFDFIKVHDVMTYLNWTWFSSNTETQVPSVGELVLKSMQILELAYKNLLENSEDIYSVETGGLKATACIDDEGSVGFQLEFILASWSDV